jgi:putative transcriptional regulator
MKSRKPLTDEELAGWESTRDVGSEMQQSVREMLAGEGYEVSTSPVAGARANVGLSQAQFATLLGISKRTLQQWEQGRRQPSGAARTLIELAQRHPEVLRELAA